VKYRPEFISRRTACGVLLTSAVSSLRAQERPWEAATRAGLRAQEQGELDEAQKQFELALSQAKTVSADDLVIADCLDNVARSLHAPGTKSNAIRDRDRDREVLYKESLSMRENRLGPDHADVALSLGRMASTLPEKEGARLFSRASGILQQHPPPGLVMAEFLEIFAPYLHRYSRKDDELRTSVEPLYRRLLDIREQIAGRDYIGLAVALELNAVVLQKLKQVEQAKPLAARASELRVRHVQMLQMAYQEPAPQQASPRRIGGDVTKPVLLNEIEPGYTDLARQVKFQGAATFTLVVGEDGSPKGIHLRRSCGLGLDEEGMFALRRWRFRPGEAGGLPVPVIATIEVAFKLR